jgi:phage terminase large subunit-like protein
MGRTEVSDYETYSALLARAAAVEGEALERLLEGLPAPARRRILEDWWWQVHGGQAEPEGEWRVWMLRAGRGFGKTRAGAEWVWARARRTPGARIALVGADYDDAVKVMIDGPGGLRAAAREGEPLRWVASKRRLDMPGGVQAFVYSGEVPDKLRGPEHDFAWCDELAKWKYPDSAWDNLMLGLRLGERPRTLVTTTPKAVAILRRIMGLERFVETRGATADNVHSSADFRAAAYAAYEKSRLGRQELEGELIEEVEGSLWPPALIEASRHREAPSREHFRRVVIGVDPPAGARGTCGIVACGLGADGIGYVLGDHSAGGLSPEGWARRVVAAAEAWGAERVVVEVNQGGDMVASVLRGVDPALPVRPVRARYGKSVRAEPVAIRFETGGARFAGVFPELEKELAGMTVGGAYQGPGTSPDRADAMIWALTELLLAPPRAEPRIRIL